MGWSEGSSMGGEALSSLPHCPHLLPTWESFSTPPTPTPASQGPGSCWVQGPAAGVLSLPILVWVPVRADPIRHPN